MLLTAPAMAEEFRYDIRSLDSIDQGNTSAVIDLPETEIDEGEIRLPRYMPNAVDFLGDSFEYIVLAPNGVLKVDSSGTITTIVDASSLDNPLAGIAGSSNYPDFLVAHGNQVTHYSLASNYMANPLLTTEGYTNVVSLASRGLDHAVLSDQGITYNAFNGSEMVTVSALSIGAETPNPIAMSLFDDHYGMAVLQGDSVGYYKNGTITSTIAGLNNALSISASDGGNLAVISDKQVKHYNLLNDNSFAYNSHLSVTSGLTAPTCVALRPGSYDRIIVDGDEIKYYMWNGTSLVLNPMMSKTIEGLQDMGTFYPQAQAVSVAYTAHEEITHAKIYVDPELQTQEPDTSISWFISTDGIDWVETVFDQWTAMPAGNKTIYWKAVLKTNNRYNTPRINPDIVLQVNTKPSPPTIITPPLVGEDSNPCYLNSSPEIRWSFNDADTNDTQSTYHVIVTALDGTVIEDKGYILSSQTSYILDQAAEGKLYNTGQSEFTVSVSVKDAAGAESAPSSKNFCVIAFDRPYLEILSPPNEGYIIKGLTQTQLPTTKAGGLVTVTVASIGLNNTQFSFTPHS